MNQTLAVRLIEGRCNGSSDVHGEVWPKAFLFVQQIAQTFALHVLHNDRLSAVEFDAVVHGHNVWVRKFRARNCFPTKTLSHLHVVG